MPNVILKLNGTKIDSLEALRENFNPEEIQNAMRGVPKLQTWLREHDLDDLADQLEHVKVYMDLPEIARKLQLPDDKIKELEQEEPEEIKLLRADLRTCKQELSDKEEELRAKLEKKEEELRALKKALESEEPEETKLLREDLKTCEKELTDKENELQAIKEERLKKAENSLHKNGSEDCQADPKTLIKSIDCVISNAQHASTGDFFWKYFYSTESVDRIVTFYNLLSESIQKSIRQICVNARVDKPDLWEKFGRQYFSSHTGIDEDKIYDTIVRKLYSFQSAIKILVR